MIWKNIRFVLAWILYYLSITCKAQTPYIQAIQYPYQLPTQTIYDMLVDKQGQIFLGTNKGLFKFNGKSTTFVPFEQARQLDITHLKEDKQGRVWGMNFTRQIFYLEDDTLRLAPIALDEITGTLMNFDLMEQQLWILMHNGLFCYDIRTFERLFIYPSQNMHLHNVSTFQNKIYVSGYKRFLVFSKDYTFIKETQKTEEEIIFQKHHKKLYALQHKNQKRVIYLWENDKPKSLPNVQISEKIFINNLVATNEKLWVCTRTGGYEINPITGQVSLVFPNKNITDIIQDYQGNFWISTLNEGLWFCPSLQNIAFDLPLQTEISSVYALQNRLYVGDVQGNIAIIPIPNQHQIQFEEKKIKLFKAGETEIRRINIDTAQKFLVAGKGLFDLEGTQLNPLPLLKDTRFFENSLLLASSFSFYLVKLQREIYTSKKYYGFKLDTIVSKNLGLSHYTDGRYQRGYSVEIDTKKKRFWIGYDNILLEYDSIGRSVPLNTNDNKTLVASCLALDNYGRLWVGTFQQGLYIFKNRKVIAHFKMGKVLKSNHIRKLVVEKNKIWIGTEAEIGYMDTKTMTFVDILAQNGLSGFFYKDFFPAQQGIWVAVSHHIIRIPYQNQSTKNELRLLPIKKKLSKQTYHIEALHYKNPSKVHLKYFLKGFHKDWQTIEEAQTTLYFPNLLAGTYALEVFAEDMITGLRSHIQKEIIVIPIRWWESFWFYLLIFLGLNGIVFWFLYHYFDKKRRKQLIKEQLWISQLKALRSQMNPHFLYNVLNTVQGLVYTNRQAEAGDLLGNFSDLMRNMLQISEKPYITLHEEIELLQLYVDLEKIRFEDELVCNIHIDFPIDSWECLIPSMLLQPFVENAFKHGLLHKVGTKKLDIYFQRIAKTLCVIIQDNGIGRTHAQEIQKRQARKSTNFALNATTQRINLLNQMQKHKINIETIDLYDQEQKALGTKIIIKIEY